MNCTICGKPIVLVPSAKERARKFGGKPSDYTKLFTAHAECQLKKREAETLDLMGRNEAMKTDETTHNEPTFEVLSIDAWADGEVWMWNEWYSRGSIPRRLCTPDKPRKMLNYLRGMGCDIPVGGVMVRDDGFNYVVHERSTWRPLYAVEYGSVES